MPREEWCWQLLLRAPDSLPDRLVEQVAGRDGLPVRLVRLAEGRCVQALHVGPYHTEPETLAAMGELMHQRGLTVNGRHHEIYLASPTDTIPPEQVRTILRQPVRQAGSNAVPH